MPRRASPRAGQYGTRQSKQESTQMQNRCTLMHADGPESGMVLHGRNRTVLPKEPRRCGGPAPSARIRVHLFCICVESFLLASPRAARRRKGPRPPRASQNPMHLYRRRRSHRRPRHHARPATATTTRRPPPNRPHRTAVRCNNPMHQRSQGRPPERKDARSMSGGWAHRSLRMRPTGPTAARGSTPCTSSAGAFRPRPAPCPQATTPHARRWRALPIPQRISP